MSEENNNEKQPPKPEATEVRGKGRTYLIHVYAAQVPDEELDDVLRIIINLLMLLGKSDTDA